MPNLNTTDLMELARHAKSLGATLKGGAGSGNHGHSGRKGKRGGSSSGSGHQLASMADLKEGVNIRQTSAGGEVQGTGKITAVTGDHVFIKWEGQKGEFKYPKDAVNHSGGGGLQGIEVSKKPTKESAGPFPVHTARVEQGAKLVEIHKQHRFGQETLHYIDNGSKRDRISPTEFTGTKNHLGDKLRFHESDSAHGNNSITTTTYIIKPAFLKKKD